MTGEDHEVVTSDEQLVLQLAAADEQALVVLHRRYAPHLTALARQMLTDPVAADMCVRAAFVRAWETAAEFDPHQLSAKTWLVTLSHRLFRDYVRNHIVEEIVREQKSAPRAAKDRELFSTDNDNDKTGQENPNAPRGGVTAAHELLRRAFFQGYTGRALAKLTGQPLETVEQELRATLEQLSRAAERKP